jgi:uncharacterized protein YggU (UPF0235/DUF167 family)
MIAGRMNAPPEHSGLDGVVTEGRSGAVLHIRVRPRSRRRGVIGVVGSELAIGVGAAPEGGRATAEATAAVANWLDLPASRLSLSGGIRSRSKRLVVSGETAPALRARVAAKLAANPR